MDPRIKLLNCSLCQVYRLISISRSFYLAEKFQPKPKKQLYSYEEYNLHPADRLIRREKFRNLDNVDKDGRPLNVGFKVAKLEFKMPKRSASEAAEIEQKSRLMQLDVNLEETFREFEKYESGNELKKIYEYYSIYNDLFSGAQFTNIFPLNVEFLNKERVFYGNILTPTQGNQSPLVSLKIDDSESKESKFWWSLILTCPDGHLTKDNEAGSDEYLHWAVCNIPANQNSSLGEAILPYLPPIPYRGTGYHRYVFVAFYHAEKIDFGSYFKLMRDRSSCNLDSRSFSTLKFYKNFENQITPLSSAFFQAKWDPTVTETFHKVLGLKEPGFEWDGPPRYVPPYERFPRNVDISYYEQYHPDLYTRHDKDTYIDKEWDKIWNKDGYRETVVSNVDDIEKERLEKVWREDFNEQFLTDEEQYEKTIGEILKKYNYREKPKDAPMFGYLY